MEKSERNELVISATPERLDEGSPEERACFSALGISYGQSWLTEGYDAFVPRLRFKPLLSAYHFAEWIAWNWWRLRWEPRSGVADWQFAHHLATIGEGYVWPNITIFSDGERVALIARPSREKGNRSLRYISDVAVVISANEFEFAVAQFIEQMRGRLREQAIADSNLDRVWEDIRAEQNDSDSSQRRKLEALLGRDPDTATDSDLEQLLTDAKSLGQEGVCEIAAEFPYSRKLLTRPLLQGVAQSSGFEASPNDMAQLAPDSNLYGAPDLAAWRVGAGIAKELREQENLGSGLIDNKRLAALAGVQQRALAENTSSPVISFALDNGQSRIVLRSKWLTGRRFELARILGDRIASRNAERLYPATRAYTYRQKVQRAFAAELLSPFAVVDQMLAGDYSLEAQQDVAAHFEVSELTIRTLLVNHRRLGRGELEEEFGVPPSAPMVEM